MSEFRADILSKVILLALFTGGCSSSSVIGTDGQALERDPSFATFTGNGPFVINQPKEARFSSPASIDYVAAMQNIDAPDEKFVVYRSENVLKEELFQYGLVHTTISDLKSGASIRFGGRIAEREGITLKGGAKSDPMKIYRLKGEGRAFNERCHLWAFDGPSRSSDKCITDDGIVLWQKDYGERVAIDRSYKVIALARRTLSNEELSIPSALLEWSTWMAGGHFDVNSQPNDEVILQGRDGANRLLKVEMIRRLGENIWISEAQGRGLNQRLSWSGVNVRFEQDERGNPLELSISREEQQSDPAPALKGVPTHYQSIKGFKCGWRVDDSFSEGSTSECRSANGMLLKKSSSYMGSMTEMTAATVRVGKLRKRDFQPPANWLNTRFWTLPAVD